MGSSDPLPSNRGPECRERDCRCGRYARCCACGSRRGLSQRAIGASMRLSTGAVNSYLSRARLAGLGWPLPDGLDDARLEALLYPPPSDVATERRPVPDWAVVHRELRRPNVTLALLWEEYRNGPGGQDGFGYSCYVVAGLMLRLVARARDAVGNPGSIRNIEIALQS